MTTKTSAPAAQRATDPRLTAETQDERLSSPQGADPRRDNRAMDDRAITESPFHADPELVSRLRDEFTNVKLPSIPKNILPGWHLIWLSTTNSQDSIPFRMSLGYQPVKAEELEGRWSMPPTVKAGDYAGMIGVAEMVLFKIPEASFQALMKAIHHDAPLEEEQSIKARLPQGQRVAKETDVDGFNDLGRSRRAGFE